MQIAPAVSALNVKALPGYLARKKVFFGTNKPEHDPALPNKRFTWRDVVNLVFLGGILYFAHEGVSALKKTSQDVSDFVNNPKLTQSVDHFHTATAESAEASRKLNEQLPEILKNHRHASENLNALIKDEQFKLAVVRLGIVLNNLDTLTKDETTVRKLLAEAVKSVIFPSFNTPSKAPEDDPADLIKKATREVDTAVLKKFLSNDESKVRKLALDTMKPHADKKAILELLQPLCKDTDPDIRKELVKVLIALPGSNGEISQLRRQYLVVLSTDKDREIQMHAQQALKKLPQ